MQLEAGLKSGEASCFLTVGRDERLHYAMWRQVAGAVGVITGQGRCGV